VPLILFHEKIMMEWIKNQTFSLWSFFISWCNIFNIQGIYMGEEGGRMMFRDVEIADIPFLSIW
jgi:hypothetical protein